MSFTDLSGVPLFAILNANKALNISANIENYRIKNTQCYVITCFVNSINIATALVLAADKSNTEKGCVYKYQVRFMKVLNAKILNIPLINIFKGENPFSDTKLKSIVAEFAAVSLLGAGHWSDITACKLDDSIFMTDYSFYRLHQNKQAMEFEYFDVFDSENKTAEKAIKQFKEDYNELENLIAAARAEAIRNMNAGLSDC